MMEVKEKFQEAMNDATMAASDGLRALLELQRFLEEHDGNNTNSSHYGVVDNTTAATTTNNETRNSTKGPSDSAILRNTFSTYGSAFVVILLLFCVLRRRFPRAFNLRSWVEDRKTTLANDQYGFFSWAWKLASLPDELMMSECGMDAVCFVRILNIGIKFCMVGMGCFAFLAPLYFTAEDSVHTVNVTDNVAKMTTGNVPPGSPRLVGTAIAAYLVFGYAMYLIHWEFERWFLIMRYRFLSQPKERNYGVYLRNIPLHYQNNQAIRSFFEKCLGVDVLECHVAMQTKNLQGKTAEREKVLFQLEHSLAIEEIKGVRPTHTVDSLVGVPVPGIGLGETVDSIEYYAKELKALNQDITKRIETLRDEADKEMEVRAVTSGDWEVSNNENDEDNKDDNLLGFVQNNTLGVLSNVVDTSSNVFGGATDLVANAAGQAVNLLGGEEDGEIYSAGFVVFKKLSTVQAALRMTHYEVPYTMEVLEAPDPDDIYWMNVGRQHKDLQLGQLFSLAATTATCLLWTIPVSFVASLSSVEALRESISALDDLLNYAPWLAPLFEVLAPQLLVILNAMLPVILTIFTKLEGPISGAMVEASLFMKLSAFMIIQTFFVSALSGSIMQELTNIIQDPLAIVNLLANSLPVQATFFMQLSVIMTVTTFAIEGLRVVPLAIALVRRCVGPNLTEKERQTTYLGLAPLNEPSDFPHADFLSNMVLFFIIFFVYAVIAPLVSFILALCFCAMGSIFRHHFVYIYNAKPDSGGFLYLNFIRILTKCLLIGEVTISGLLALKKAPSTVMMLPLIITTVLFNAYLAQKHYSIAEHLPSRVCLKHDKKKEDMDYAFVQEAYLQPELREKQILPELTHVQLEELGFRAPNEEDGEASVAPSAPESDIVSCRVTKLKFSFSRSDDDETFPEETRTTNNETASIFSSEDHA